VVSAPTTRPPCAAPPRAAAAPHRRPRALPTPVCVLPTLRPACQRVCFCGPPDAASPPAPHVPLTPRSAHTLQGKHRVRVGLCGLLLCHLLARPQLQALRQALSRAAPPRPQLAGAPGCTPRPPDPGWPALAQLAASAATNRAPGDLRSPPPFSPLPTCTRQRALALGPPHQAFAIPMLVVAISPVQQPPGRAQATNPIFCAAPSAGMRHSRASSFAPHQTIEGLATSTSTPSSSPPEGGRPKGQVPAQLVISHCAIKG
jgi:hypothetical protein